MDEEVQRLIQPQVIAAAGLVRRLTDEAAWRSFILGYWKTSVLVILKARGAKSIAATLRKASPKEWEDIGGAFELSYEQFVQEVRSFLRPSTP